jgi:hypothetical protein
MVHRVGEEMPSSPSQRWLPSQGELYFLVLGQGKVTLIGSEMKALGRLLRCTVA